MELFAVGRHRRVAEREQCGAAPHGVVGLATNDLLGSRAAFMVLGL